MIPTVDVRADMSGVKLFLGALEREKVVAAVRGLTRAAEGARTDAVKALRPLYPNVKVASLRARVRVEKANASKLQSSARFSGSRIPMYGNFGMRTRGKFGVSFSKRPFRIEQPDGTDVDAAMLARAFRNRLLKGGRPAVLARLGDSRRPITVLLAPAISQALVEKKLMEALAAGGRARFIKEYERTIRVLVQRRSRQ